MLFGLMVVLALASVSQAHFRLNYAPANLPIRNAPTATADGAWSTDQAGCGGEATWGKNGVTEVRAGDSISFSFNYGTGASGDHRDNNNRLRVVFVSLDDLANNTNNELARVRSTNQNEDQQVSPLLLRVLEDQMDASVGSRPEAYAATITVPPILCKKCVLAALDQRNWGGCIDISVVGTLPPATTVAFVPNVCGNGKVERDAGEQCELGDGCCTAKCQFGAAIDGCPCVDYDCESPFTCECADQASCTTRSPKCMRGKRSDGSSAAALALASTAAVMSAAALL